jgi:hypothetical protein
MCGKEFANRQFLRFSGKGDALGHELAQRRLVGLLQLAPPTGSKVATGRIDMVRAGKDRAVFANRVAGNCARHMGAAGSHTVALGGDP